MRTTARRFPSSIRRRARPSVRCPAWAPPRRAARSRPPRRRSPRGRPDREGARARAAAARRPDAGAHRRARRADGDRAGQAARRGEGRDRVRRVLLRVVRRGGEALEGGVIPTPWPEKRIVVTREPIGVTAGITPWNFPSAMPTRKSAPALAVGCTMVLKPAEQTPLSALAVAALAEEAGVPPGVFSVVTGDAEDAPAIGGEMTSNPLVRKLGFTGSTEVGEAADAPVRGPGEEGLARARRQRAVHRLRRRRPRRGGPGALVCKFRNSGQTCISAEPDARPGRDLRRVPRARSPTRSARWRSATASPRACRSAR